MTTTENLKAKLEQIPNNVSGDGKNFVAQLKRFLKGFRDDTEEKIDGIGAGAVEQVSSLSLMETHTYDALGNPVNNIFVSFSTVNITDYLNAQVWMKKSTENAYQMVGTTSSTFYTISDVTAGITYNVKVVACNTNAGTSDFATAPTANITIEGSNFVPAAPTQFFLTWDEEGPLWQWQFVDNGYVDFFELRMDGYAGTWNANRLDSTRNNYSRAEPPARSGTAYLFIRNVYGAYSQPATHTFNIVAPRKPTNPVLDVGLDGVVITMEALPTGSYSYRLEITDFEDAVETFDTENSQFTFFQFSGSVSVKYAFVDGNGRGEWSNTVTTTISGEHVDGARIKANSIIAAKIAANTITSDKLYSGSVQTSRITANQLQIETRDGTTGTIITPGAVSTNNIQAGSIIADKIAANTITSDQLQVRRIDTGGTVITPGAVATTNIQALAITTDKLDAQAVTAAKIASQTITADQIAANTITSAKLQVYNESGGTVITPGAVATNNIQAGAITAAKIAANTITANQIASNTITANQIASNTITSAKIYAGSTQSDLIQANNIATNSITANKLNVSTLSAISADVGFLCSATSGARVEIEKDQIRVYDTAGTLRVKIGVW